MAEGVDAMRNPVIRLIGLVRRGDLPTELARATRALGETDPDLPLRLTEALAEELPLNRRDGRFVREGHDATLDELRLLQVDSRKVIAQLQARYAAETGCRTLRIKHNAMLGYFVEVPQAMGEEFLKEPWRATFVHDDLRRLELIDGGRVPQWLTREPGGRVHYENARARRRLDLTITRVDTLPGFDAAIWR